MDFENIIKRISSIAATVIVFVIAAGIYLGAKGFQIDVNGNVTLSKSANAAPAATITAEQIDNDVKVDYASNRILGKSDAPITIYEHSSFACSHCADFHIYTLPKIKEEFIDKGLVKVIFVDFPIDKKSMQASLISYCVPEKDYFEFLNIVFKNQSEWSYSFNAEKVFTKYATLFGMTQKDVQECLKNESKQNDILVTRQAAIDKYKIQGTPTFVIDYQGKQEIINGAPNFSTLKEMLNNKLGIKG